jgi:hypothetical protein
MAMPQIEQVDLAVSVLLGADGEAKLGARRATVSPVSVMNAFQNAMDMAKRRTGKRIVGP